MKLKAEKDLLKLLQFTLAKIIYVYDIEPTREIFHSNLLQLFSKSKHFVSCIESTTDFATDKSQFKELLDRGDLYYQPFQIPKALEARSIEDFCKIILKNIQAYVAHRCRIRTGFFRSVDSPLQSRLGDIIQCFSQEATAILNDTVSSLPVLQQIEINFIYENFGQLYQLISKDTILTHSNLIISQAEIELLRVILKITQGYFALEHACSDRVNLEAKENWIYSAEKIIEGMSGANYLPYFGEHCRIMLEKIIEAKSEYLFSVTKNAFPQTTENNEAKGSFYQVRNLLRSFYGPDNFRLAFDVQWGIEQTSGKVTEVSPIVKEFLNDTKVRDSFTIKLLREINATLLLEPAMHSSEVGLTKEDRADLLVLKDKLQEITGLVVDPKTNRVHYSRHSILLSP